MSSLANALVLPHTDGFAPEHNHQPDDEIEHVLPPTDIFAQDSKHRPDDKVELPEDVDMDGRQDVDETMEQETALDDQPQDEEMQDLFGEDQDLDIVKHEE